MAELGKVPIEKALQCPQCQNRFSSWQLPELENFRCPECRCWLRLPSPSRPAPTRLNCPVCDGHLDPHRCPTSGLEIDACADCGGLWFDRDELQKVMTTPGLLEALQLPSPKLQPKGQGAHLCLRCLEQPLKQYHLGDVEVDACTQCRGSWLDGGELDRLTRAPQVNPQLGLVSQLLNAFRALFQRD